MEIRTVSDPGPPIRHHHDVRAHRIDRVERRFVTGNDIGKCELATGAAGMEDGK